MTATTLILADDLSGATDCAVAFARCGVHVVLALDDAAAATALSRTRAPRQMR